MCLLAWKKRICWSTRVYKPAASQVMTRKCFFRGEKWLSPTPPSYLLLARYATSSTPYSSPHNDVVVSLCPLLTTFVSEAGASLLVCIKFLKKKKKSRMLQEHVKTFQVWNAQDERTRQCPSFFVFRLLFLY